MTSLENVFAEVLGATLTIVLVDFVLERGKRQETWPVNAAIMREAQLLSSNAQNVVARLSGRLKAIPTVNISNEYGCWEYDYGCFIPRRDAEEHRTVQRRSNNTTPNCHKAKR